jgi:uncharacterized protein (DUF2147 family)
MKKLPLALIAAAVTVAPSTSPAATKFPSDAILGEWCTQREENRPPARIRFVRSDDGTFAGVVSWSADPRKDVNNKDPKLRDRSIVGMVLMWHLRYDDGEYVDGRLYNPEDGGTYRVKAEVLSQDSLRIHGYLGISLLGQDKTWSRFHPS